MRRIFAGWGAGLLILGATTAVLPAADPVAAEVRAAFKRLAEAPGHTFHLSMGDQAGRPGQERILAGATDRQGLTACSATSPNGTFAFVFKRRKGVIQTPTGWKTLADLTNPNEAAVSGRPRPMRSELSLLTGGKMPAAICLELLDGFGNFRREGDVYRAEATPEAANEMLGAGMKDPGMTLQASVQVWLKGGFPVRLELQQRITGAMKPAEFKMSAVFSDIGATRVDVPPEARQRLERIHAAAPGASDGAARAGGLSRQEASALARAFSKQLEHLRLKLVAYAMGNNLRAPDGKSANEAFRELFRVGLCEDESPFALPDPRARTAPPPDGDIGTIEDGFSKALAPGECDVTFVAWPAGTMAPPQRPLLRADVRASDGTVFVVVVTTGGDSRVLETADGIARGSPPNDKADMFSREFGVVPASILKPELRP